MKFCSFCEIEKSDDLFNKHKTRKDGLQRYCKDCSSKYYKEHIIKKSKNYVINIFTKKCSICELTKDSLLFNINIINSDGFDSRCKDCVSIYNKEYRKNNISKLRQNKTNYCRNRRKTDPIYKLKDNIRSRTHNFLKRRNFIKKSTFNKYIGCTILELVKHIESKFTGHMNWENYGKWHIDHIIPLATAHTVEEVYKLNHYTNLQPLWAIDNIKKGCKIE